MPKENLKKIPSVYFEKNEIIGWGKIGNLYFFVY